MSDDLHADGFKWVKSANNNKDFIKNCNKSNNVGYILKREMR